jgi:LysW-gamma-L-lysine carboxypeptidase
MDDHALLQRLVAIPSPTGSEAAAVGFLQDQARDDGFTVQRDAAGNFIAEAGPRSRSAPTLAFLGHVDTVPGDIPVRIEDGEVWGRGSVDAKGALAAAYCAVRRRLDGDIRIVLVGCVDEEGRSRGARALLASWQGRPPDWIVNGEPSGTDAVTVAYKGILRGRIEGARPSRHGGHPDANAMDAFVAAWADLRRRLAVGTGFDDVTARLDSLAGSDDGLASRVAARVQFRLPPTTTPPRVAAVVEAALAGVAVLHIEEALAAARADRRSPLVAAFTAAIRAGGAAPRVKRKTGTSDMNVVAPALPGVPWLAYGPGDSHLDHTPNERLALAEFDRAVAVWGHALVALGVLPPPSVLAPSSPLPPSSAFAPSAAPPSRSAVPPSPPDKSTQRL